MKSIIPDPAQLDELAAGLDAGWDDEPAETSPSQPPRSSPLPDALDALDADWDVAAKPAVPTAPPSRSGQPRPSAARPSPARPSPTRAVTPPATPSSPPLRASKQERRDAERKRRAHEAQQKAANKKLRKAERQAEAQRANEQLRKAEQQALAERRARQAGARKRAQPKPEAADTAKRTAKRIQREQSARTPPAAETMPAKREPKARGANVNQAKAIREERGAKKLIVPLLIALLFAVTLGFALSRAR